MATSFPSSVDIFPNPTALTPRDSPGDLGHHTQHANVNDAVTAIERYLLPLTASMSGGSNQENGASIATVNLVWSYSGTITSQTLTGINTVAPALGDRAQTVTGPYTTSHTWNISGSNGVETAGNSTSLTFYDKRYWGVSSNATLTDAQIIALSSELASSYSQSRSFSPSGQYIYFAFPHSFGASPTFTVNGLLNNAWTAVRSNSAFVNASGASVAFDLWRSDNLLTASYSVAVS